MPLLLFCYLFLHLLLGTAHGGCSQKCQPSADLDANQTTPLFPCSCSPSCSVYRDCCFDSLYRDSNRTVKRSDTMCLTLEGTGHFRAVASCPRHWPGSNQFCGESIGYLPPVTSKATGVTYANIYCAVCHDDGDNLVTWNTELKCCPEHETKRDRYFSYRQEQLWSRLPRGGRCLCRYRPHDSSTAFLSGLELRDCGRSHEISQCSTTWTGDEKRLCPIYQDPVYAGDRVFKNPHCAKCNFKKEKDTQCVPSVVTGMVAAGANFTQIARYCERENLSLCSHYVRGIMVGKGFGYDFSQIFLSNVNRSVCVPEPGERCCKGYIFHFKSKKCKKVHQ